jgi:hypothetical protein
VDILPFARETYGFLRSALAPPSAETFQPIPGEVLAIEGGFGAFFAPRPYRARLGFLDFERPLASLLEEGTVFGDPGRLPIYAVLPVTGRFDDGSVTAIFLGGKAGADGLLPIEGGAFGVPAWGRIVGDDLVISTRPEVAALAARELRIVQAGSPGQARLRFDLRGSPRVLPALRIEAYRRVRTASRGSTLFLSNLHGTLKVPLEACEEEAQRILGARLACPAGGKLRGAPYPPGGGPFFASDAFPREGAARPEGEELRAETFRSPVLDALRTLEVSLTLTGRSLHSEASIVLIRGEDPDGGG